MSGKTCSIEGCDGKHYGRGWCRLHWQHWRRTGDPHGVRRIPGTPPVVEVGERFGRLVVVEFSHTDRLRYYRCVCDCGQQYVAAGTLLKNGVVRSCGCLHPEVIRAILTTHGQSGSPTWSSFKAMVGRCLDPNHIAYGSYGAKGVKPADRWNPQVTGSFASAIENFLEDMGPRPAGTSLGRFGDTGNYEPGNCAWQTREEQAAEQAKKRAKRSTS